MNYNGENWEIGDTLVHLEIPSFKCTLLAHSRSDDWRIPKDWEGQCAYPDRYTVLAKDVVIRALVDYGNFVKGSIGAEDPKFLTKLLPPAIENHVHQEKPIENTGEEELLKAA